MTRCAVIVTTFAVGLTAATACNSAVVAEHRNVRQDTWVIDTLLRADAPGASGLSPAQVEAWGADTLVMVDARHAQLVWAIRRGNTYATAPLPTARYRGNLPWWVRRAGRHTLLVGGLGIWESVNVVTGQRTKLTVPTSSWGGTPIGSFACAGTSGAIVMAQAASSRSFPTRSARPDTGGMLTLLETPDASPVRYFGPIIPDHNTRDGASVEANTRVLGWVGDTVVTMSMYSGRARWYWMRSRPGRELVREIRLPREFEPRATVEPSATVPEVVYQPQLRDAVLTDFGYAVLQVATFRWSDWRPWRHAPGRWQPLLVYVEYDRSGRVLRRVPLPPTEPWRGISYDPSTQRVVVFGTADPTNVTGVILGRIHPR